jgi:hypothetical protein
MLTSVQKGKHELSRRWLWSNATVAAASAPPSSSPSVAATPSTARAATEQQHFTPLFSSLSSPLARENSSTSSNSSSRNAPQHPPFDAAAPDLDLNLDPATEITLGARLGSGSFGIVHECEYKGRRCACKLLKAHIFHELREGLEQQHGENGDNNSGGGGFHNDSGSLAAARTFAREISILASLPKHPRVVSLYAACLKPPTICLVEELVEGGSLANAIKLAAASGGSSSSPSLPSSPSAPSAPSPSAALDLRDLRALRAGGLEYGHVLR